jgi:hypothetical protein
MVEIYTRLENRLEMKEKATMTAKNMGFELLDFRYLTNNPLDEYLFVALCYKQEAYQPYVVWTYNSEFNSFSNGYYSSDSENAELKFKTKS